MPASEAARLKRQATARAYRQRKRAEARAQKALALPAPAPPLGLEAPPILVHAGDPAPVSPAPALPPVALPPAIPPPPAYTPFRYDAAAHLSADGLGAVTLFHEHWLQPPDYATQLATAPTDAARLDLYRRARREAREVLPHLRQQYRDACVGPDGATSQEARQVKQNLDWVEALLAQEG